MLGRAENQSGCGKLCKYRKNELKSLVRNVRYFCFPENSPCPETHGPAQRGEFQKVMVCGYHSGSQSLLSAFLGKIQALKYPVYISC